MLERVSALASAHPYKSSVLTIAEDRQFSLTQVAGLSPDFEKKLAGAVGELPAKIGPVAQANGRALMRIGPRQFWLIGPEHDETNAKLSKFCAVVPLSNSRTRIRIEGSPARAVLAKGIPLDFHESVFVPGSFALTGLHHMPLTIHCTGANSFHIYAMRTFALCAWEWLTDAALEFADH